MTLRARRSDGRRAAGRFSECMIGTHAACGTARSAFRQRLQNLRIHRARTVDHRRIDAGNLALDNPVARVDLALLADHDILGLRLLYLQRGL